MCFPLVFLLLLVPILAGMLFFNVALFSFARLGLSPEGAVVFLIASLIGGMVNIPVSRKRFPVPRSVNLPLPFYFFYYPPLVQERVICVNVGGAVIPVLFSVYLLVTRAPLGPSLLGIALVAAVTKALARPVQGVGIALPAFLPPLLAVGISLVITRGAAAPVAYVAGVLGTLIGADLLNLRAIRELGAQMVSIGGAGVFDGIFLVGIVAAFLG